MAGTSNQHPTSPSTGAIGPLRPEVERFLQPYWALLSNAEAGRKLWVRLSETERQALGGDFERCHKRIKNTLDLWASLKGCSEVRALVDVGRRLGHFTESDYRWLLDEIGEADEPAAGSGHAGPAATKPSWNGQRCELFYRGTVVRKIRSRTVAEHVTRILDAFEEEGWPDRIDDPLPGGSDPQRLREAVSSLNRGLTVLCFRADGTGQGILWERRASPARRGRGTTSRK
jgi:hypothetical protein